MQSQLNPPHPNPLPEGEGEKSTSAERRLAILVAFSGAGGVEAGILNLLPAFLEAGVAVDLLGIFKRGVPAALQPGHPNLRIVDLGVRHTHLILPALVRYLHAQPPAALLVAKDRAIRMAILARALSGAKTRLVGQLNTHLSAALAGKPAVQRWWRTFPMGWFYPHADLVVAVSEGVAEDTHLLTGLPPERIPVIRNPVIGPELYDKARRPVDHPWFRTSDVPVILAAGRLTRQKDFGTLIRAFALLRRRRSCRLVILGGGPEREDLERQTEELGLTEDVALPGHVDNPFAYMARAALFVLSSRWEGSGNVLTEAMALGVPVVSTDCPSGPAEMLDGGRFGPLVPVGDAEALAEAMERTLDHPPEPAALRDAVSEYTIARSAARYLEVLGLAS
jgi:glycosyltransferase involved in cell wall biosynthesis